jgi:hypothetical protein
MQTRISIILSLLCFSIAGLAQGSPKLTIADSLFRAKQYTQSYDIYQSLLNENNYSTAMLLKMAYIQEGLNRPGLCLYYLNLYEKASDDHQAIAKMEELAGKHSLEGYRSADTSSFYHFFKKNNVLLIRVLSTLTILSFSLLIYQKRKKMTLAVPFSLVILFASGVFIVSNLIRTPDLAIVSSNKTYLMSGPSAAASVVDIVEEGHRLTVSGKKDVWLKVKWREKDVFVKESNVLPITL